jgi:glutaredoxin 3
MFTTSMTRSNVPGSARVSGATATGASRKAAGLAPARGANPPPTSSRFSYPSALLTRAASKEDDSLGQRLINAVTVALTNSPINEGKKALAKAQAGEYDGAAWEAKIKAEIEGTPVLVYSWAGCPFCKKAKAILADANAGPQARIKILELDEMGVDGKIYRAALSGITNRTSMPQIWIGREFCGGCNDGPGVATLEREGKLKPMLAAAAALKA